MCGLDTLQKLCRSGLVGIRDCVRYLAEYEGCVLVLVLVTDLGEDREIERCECCDSSERITLMLKGVPVFWFIEI